MLPVSVAGLMLISAALPAAAQTVRRPDDGRALDANPGVGSNGVNSQVPGFEPNSANRYITGNVTGLGAFRGFNPVRDPTLFRAGLGSAGLSFFQRQSVGYGDVAAGRAAAGQYYYGSAETVINTGGIVNQLNQPGSSTPLTTNLGSRRTPQLRPLTVRELVDSGRAMELTPGTMPRDAYLQFDARRMVQNSTSPYSVAMRSPLFGVERGVPMDDRLRGMMLTDPRYQELEPAGDLTPGTDFDRVSNQEVIRTTIRPLAESESDAEAEPLPVTTEMRMRMALTQVETAAPDFLRANATERLRSALGGVNDPALSGWINRPIDAEDDLRQNQFDSLKMRTAVMQAGAKSALELVDRPVTSLAGDGATMLDKLIARGEEAMKNRRYYDAADLFQEAALLAPASANARLSRGFALFAAGDYRSASAEIVNGLSLFPDAAVLSFDLNTMFGDANVVVLRSEDLRRYLSKREDYRLRFLLGYVAINNGELVSGVRNLLSASKDAPVDSVIRAFPNWLRGVTSAPAKDSDSH